jgi:hypothetical protein
MRRKLLGNAHPEIAELFRLLGSALERQGKAEEAEFISREAKRALTGVTNATPK